MKDSKREVLCQRRLRSGWELTFEAFDWVDNKGEKIRVNGWFVVKGDKRDAVEETTALALILDAKGAR